MVNNRLNKLREAMSQHDIDVYYFNTSDYHMSEYVADFFKTIAYFSGFTGSLATLLVDQENAYIFVDGRYHIQADEQCGKYGIKVMKLGMKDVPEPLEFIKDNYADKTIGFDGRRTSVQFGKQLLKNKINIKSIDIYSDVIEDRTPLSNNQIYELETRYAGLSRKTKIEIINHSLKNTCHIINNLESIAYLLNLRSDDVEHTPVFMSYLVILDKQLYLFVDSSRLSKQTLNSLYEDGIIIRSYGSYYEFLDLIKSKKITFDETKVNYETYLRINKNNNRILNKRSIVEDMKAVKCEAEQNNARQAHIYDGVAVVRFLKWLDSIDKKTISEYDAARKIDEFRLQYKAFDTSFNSIVAYNENAAIMHYFAQEDNCKKLDNKGLLLFDTGGQYLEGTTDITRTIALGPVDDQIKKWFTLVLKSMFNLSELVFLKGMSGNQIDVVARKDLWKEYVDYRCGTGHGVGHILSVHEGPPNIRYGKTAAGTETAPFKEGMICSDEPGVYFENEFGIRCENMILCKKVSENEYGEFLGFETLTLVPFDLKLIDKKYLDEKTIEVLNGYHQRVYETLLPYLNYEEGEYLRKITKAI